MLSPSGPAIRGISGNLVLVLELERKVFRQHHRRHDRIAWSKSCPIVVVFTIIIWLVIMTTLFWMFFQLQIKDSFLLSLALAIISLFALFLLAPDIRQSLYWGQGMRSVVPPLLMGTLQVILWNYFQAQGVDKAATRFLGNIKLPLGFGHGRF